MGPQSGTGMVSRLGPHLGEDGEHTPPPLLSVARPELVKGGQVATSTVDRARGQHQGQYPQPRPLEPGASTTDRRPATRTLSEARTGDGALVRTRDPEDSTWPVLGQLSARPWGGWTSPDTPAF